MFKKARRIIRPDRSAQAQRDSALLFRTTTGSLTGTETSSWLNIPGVVATGLTLVVTLPKQSSGDTVQAIIDESTDGVTPETGNNHQLIFINSKTVTTTGVQVHRRRFNPEFAYIRLRLLVLGTSPDFGAVGAWIEHGTRWNHQATNPTSQESF